MKLWEVIDAIDSFDEEHTIYAETPWTENSESIVAEEPVEGGLPIEAKRMGMEYFLEIFHAKDFLEGLQSNSPCVLGTKDKCDRLIRYAINDA